MSTSPDSRAHTRWVFRVSAAIVRSPLGKLGVTSIAALSLACGGPAAADASAEILERLDRIEARLAKIETHARDAIATKPVKDATPRDAAPPAASLSDPFTRTDAPKGTSLAIALTRTGWKVDDRVVDEAELSKLLSGVETVTVRTDDGVPQRDVVKLLDRLREADIRQVAIARFSDQSVTAGTIEP